ncbi:MAG: hypothetical protein II727_02920, partial [Oscillospiraceae bacterium]|nr:hypothetical protein [Oscillospiraceae bacterium]
ARRGVDRKAGRFLSPRLRVLLWSFLPTREESGGPKMKESIIDNPANSQICRRREFNKPLSSALAGCRLPQRGRQEFAPPEIQIFAQKTHIATAA